MTTGTRRRRVAIGVLGASVVLAGGVAAAGALGRTSGDDGLPEVGQPTVTSQVSRRTLVETFTAGGSLGHGPPTPLKATVPGTITWLPTIGTVITRGQPVLRADEQPVVLLYGPLPMYRTLALQADGRDVRQFERNLWALGYTGYRVDDTYSAATVAAVKRWQADLGWAPTGSVQPYQVVHAPRAIRVAGHTARVGDPASGDILSYSGTTKVVTLSVRADAATWAVTGAAVSVELPGGATVAGRVNAVGDEATAGQGSDTPGGGDQGTGDVAGATVPVTITVKNQKALTRYEKAPVTVRYVARQRKDVLAVPVAALLALAEGGYALEVVDGGIRRLLPVRVGLFAEGQVEVDAPELRKGMTVEMPG
ncbi:MAG TPA: peptidoglycan-binding protein [Pilimelia sp.]|nr:peptidoglycan-binding protein [Pilimelia sp.]